MPLEDHQIEWRDAAGVLIEQAIEQNPRLQSLRKPFNAMSEETSIDEWHRFLRRVLNELNRSEEVDILKQPMVQLTIAGIIFMIVMTLAIVGYYYLVLS